MLIAITSEWLIAIVGIRILARAAPQFDYRRTKRTVAEAGTTPAFAPLGGAATSGGKRWNAMRKPPGDNCCDARSVMDRKCLPEVAFHVMRDAASRAVSDARRDDLLLFLWKRPLIVKAGHNPTAPASALRVDHSLRLSRNIAWLLSSRGLSGVLSLCYLAVASRALGPSAFGAFALILSYTGAIAGFAKFRSWQAVVRYGARHRAAGRLDRLERLLGLTTSIEIFCCLVGATVAWFAAGLAGATFGWNSSQTHAAAAFAVALLLVNGEVAPGLLRLDGHFALLTGSETVASLVRLIGAATVWTAGGGLPPMLIAWAAAAWAEAGLEWGFAIFVCQCRPRFGLRPSRLAVSENSRIGRFMFDSSVASSLAVVWMQIGTLAVGAAAGEVAAGRYRIAAKLAGALSKPAEATTRAVLPEFSRLAAGNDLAGMRKIFAKATAVGTVVAILLVVSITFGGSVVLRLVAGPGFVAAWPLLLLLCFSTAVDLGAIALEPLLNARGRSRDIVKARVVGGGMYLAFLTIFLKWLGPIGAGWASLVGTLTAQFWQATAAKRILVSGDRDVG